MTLLLKAAVAEWLLQYCEGRWFNPLACSCVFVQDTQTQYSSRSCILILTSVYECECTHTLMSVYDRT